MAGAANQKRWDVCVVAALYVGLIAWNVVIPFDPKRCRWSWDFPLWMKALGGGALTNVERCGSSAGPQAGKDLSMGCGEHRDTGPLKTVPP
jgi:hypothetical protein